jgi:septal ring factor EnvC (AmiA/AmiB activator)
MKAARGSAPPGPEPRESTDPLPDLLDLASQEGALEGEALASFLEALRARARLVLAERFERLEDRLRSLEAETAWRRDSMASLEAELAWRRESMAALEENVRALGQQAERLSDELRKASEAHGALLAHHRELVDALRGASEAHGTLLAHHRELVDRVATQLVSIASLSPLRSRLARRRLLALAELLRVDSR